MHRKEFRTLVNREYCEQDHTYDSQHDHHFWLGLVLEELGESAKCINQGESPLAELVQTVALIESWVENFNYKSDIRWFQELMGTLPED